MESGFLLYVLAAALLALFRHQVRGQSFDDLLARAARDHHHVHPVLAKHPQGGTWQEHKDWLREADRSRV